MRRLKAVAAVLGSLAALLVAVGSAQAAPIRECGDLPHRYAYNITSRAVACGEARRVVRRWNRTVAQRGGNGRVRGLSCRYRGTGHEAADIRCTARAGRVVRWQTGV